MREDAPAHDVLVLPARRTSRETYKSNATDGFPALQWKARRVEQEESTNWSHDAAVSFESEMKVSVWHPSIPSWSHGGAPTV